MTSPLETAILLANSAFYEAFAQRNTHTMTRLWAREHVVACIHPGRSALVGRDLVLASFRAILDSPESPAIDFSDATAVLLGNEAAFVTCIEHIGGAMLAATNVFVLEGGEWRLVHHQAGPTAFNRESSRPAGPLN